ncbi:17241_t:CDS:2, partial [Racocetra persica]
SEKDPVKIGIATSNCSEFHCGLIKNVSIGESSSSLKKILVVNNIRPINNVVDLANLVMLETGQPFDLLDYDTLPPKTILEVRQAHKKERIITFSGQQLILNPEDIVIGADKKIISLAGIIGAKNTAITSQTRNILVACGTFATSHLKTTAFRLGITTQSSQLCTKKVNLTGQPFLSLQYLISLLKKLGGLTEQEVAIVSASSPTKKKKPLIALSENFLKKRKGVIYYLKPPFYRLDITRAEDLVEEILRIYDYNKIPISNGWQEIITYSLVSETEKAQDFSPCLDKENYRVLSPKSENHQFYRQTPIPSHLKTINYNLTHGSKDLLFFEISSTYSAISSGTYQEELLILRALENIFSLFLLLEKVNFLPVASDLNSELKGEIFLGQEKIGYLGSENKKPILFAQISLTKIFAHLTNNPPQIFYQPVSRFPVSEKDLSLIISENLDYNEIVKEIKKSGGEDLREVKVFDVYQSAKLVKQRTKSVSFHLIFQSPKRTLEKVEIGKNLLSIIRHLSE